MPLTSQEIEDFRNDIGDENKAFSADEIQRLYVRGGSYDGAIVLGIEQLLASIAKFNDYKMNMSDEDANQAFNNLQDLLEVKHSRARKAKSKSSVRLVRLSRSRKSGDKPYNA